jgi:ABC-2 type transport system permease protein
MTDLAREIRLLPHVAMYEWRKTTAFRLGFLLREVLRGVARPVVMILVYFAMFRSSGAESFSGYRFEDLVAYLIWGAILQKCLYEERTLDLAEQIFDGYITKYLVMPVHYFTLAWGKFLQFTLLQLASAAVFWCAGALLLPGMWPYPVSALALVQALVLLLLGAACYQAAHFILNCLAFWLDVVWSLLAMFRFVSIFVAGLIVPVALMPDWVDAPFRALFPYWSVFAPAEILLGRQDSSDFALGVAVLLASLALLNGLALVVWRRGLERHAGVGT